MPVQLNIFLLLFGGLQGFLLSIFLIRKKTLRTGYVFLTIYLLVMILQVVLKVMSKLWLLENMRDLYFLSYRLPFLYGPLVYLLTIHLLRPQRRFQWKDVLHFIPFAAAVFFTFNFKPGHPQYFLESLFWNADLATTAQLLSILLYHILAFRLWYRYDRSVKDHFSNIRQLQLKWLRNFIIISTAACIAVAIGIYYIYVYYPALNNFRFLFAVLTLFIYWISYSAMNQPELFTVIRGNDSAGKFVIPKLVIHRSLQKYSNSGLKEEDGKRIVAALHKLMTEQKPFLDPDITIDKLAELVSCSRHHLSQALNADFKRSFYDYINSFRIDTAKSLLSEPANDNLKIASIAYDSGFNSLSTFNDVFKKMTGQTPSQFRKLQIELSRKQRV